MSKYRYSVGMGCKQSIADHFHHRLIDNTMKFYQYKIEKAFELNLYKQSAHVYRGSDASKTDTEKTSNLNGKCSVSNSGRYLKNNTRRNILIPLATREISRIS